MICFAEEKEKDEVKLSNCESATSARFILGTEEIKVKFIGIETDEFFSDNVLDETYGKSVDEYVCSLLKEAKNITIEYEPKITLKDKFDRTNAWVFVDDILLEEHLVSLGVAKVAYIYDDYKYKDVLLEQEKISKQKEIGIWKKQVIVEESIDEIDTITKEKSKKNEGFLDAIGNFFKDLFDSIIEMINNIVEDILSK